MMAHAREVQQAEYPLPAYNFRVTINGTAVSFCEISGLQVEYPSVTYRHGLSFVEGESITTFAGKRFFSITLRRGTIPKANHLLLFAWLRARQLRGVEIDLCDAVGQPVLSWRVAQAVPVKVEAPTFDAKTQDLAIESLELQVRGVSLVDHSAA